MGNRVDFNVSQELDFPTAYIQKSRIRKIQSSQAELEYVMTRQEVLLQARQLWIEKLHLNQLEKLLQKRIVQSQETNDHFRRLLAAGEAGQLAFSQSNLQLAALESEYESVLLETRNNQLALQEMAGGDDVAVNDTIYPQPVPIDPDTLIQAYNQAPGMLYLVRELEAREAKESLAVSEHLPKLSAGYYSESVLDQQFRGFQVGITVPLWEHANTVRKARSEVSFAAADMDRNMLQLNKEIREKLDQLGSLNLRVEKLEAALGSVNDLEILALALENGEISLSEYFYSTDFYFRNQQLLLQLKRDRLIKEAELLKVYL
jgi:outer membrane protein TolC